MLPPAPLFLVPRGGTPKKTRRQTKMVRTQTEGVGFLGNLQKGLRRVRTELAKSGHDPAAVDANLDRMIGELTDENARQEEMKRELKAQTAELGGLNREDVGPGG